MKKSKHICIWKDVTQLFNSNIFIRNFGGKAETTEEALEDIPKDKWVLIKVYSKKVKI